VCVSVCLSARPDYSHRLNGLLKGIAICLEWTDPLLLLYCNDNRIALLKLLVKFLFKHQRQRAQATYSVYAGSVMYSHAC